VEDQQYTSPKDLASRKVSSAVFRGEIRTWRHCTAFRFDVSLSLLEGFSRVSASAILLLFCVLLCFGTAEKHWQGLDWTESIPMESHKLERRPCLRRCIIIGCLFYAYRTLKGVTRFSCLVCPSLFLWLYFFSSEMLNPVERANNCADKAQSFVKSVQSNSSSPRVQEEAAAPATAAMVSATWAS
jgi:hypothetical protein